MAAVNIFSSKNTLLGLLSIVFVRMFGLFLVVPVIALYAKSLPNATPLHIGLALGVYGLTQAILQIPFGALSDRFGRKPIIGIGLFIFALGSLLCATTESIYGLIIGRALQGAGAISAALMAFVADVTTEQNRTKAMALFGVSVGMSFLLAIVLAPVLEHYLNIQGLFVLSTVLAGIGLLILFLVLPSTDARPHAQLQVEPRLILRLLADSQLWRLDISIMLLHAFLAMLFVALPLMLSESAISLEKTQYMWLYGPALLASFVIMLPLIIVAERKKKAKEVLMTAIAMLALGFLLLWLFGASLYGVEAALLVFFAAFNVLEASLPSWISKVAPKEYKGTAMGVYSTSQFLGVFLGGSLSGILLQYGGLVALFATSLVLSVFWLWISRELQAPVAGA